MDRNLGNLTHGENIENKNSTVNDMMKNKIKNENGNDINNANNNNNDIHDNESDIDKNIIKDMNMNMNMNRNVDIDMNINMNENTDLRSTELDVSIYCKHCDSCLTLPSAISQILPMHSGSFDDVRTLFLFIIIV